ncbi:hypothetical protein JCM11251_000603 [Rhodosporidiobolus azoricus]
MAYNPYGDPPAAASPHRPDPPSAFPRDDDPSTRQAGHRQGDGGGHTVYAPYQFSHEAAVQPYQCQDPLQTTSWGETAGGLPGLPQYQQYGLPADANYQQQQLGYYQPQLPPERHDPLFPPPPLPVPPFLAGPQQSSNPSDDLFSTAPLRTSLYKSPAPLPFQRGSLSSGAGGSEGDGEDSGSSGRRGTFAPVYNVGGPPVAAGINTTGFGPLRTGNFSAPSGGGAGGAAATIAGASTGGSSSLSKIRRGTSSAVAALAAGIGPRTTEKSCKNCRTRKVKCDRQWPCCQRCKQRHESCSFGSFIPVDVIPASALETAVASTSSGVSAQGDQLERVAELEERIRSLEAELEASRILQPSQLTQQAGGVTDPGPAQPGSVLSHESSTSAAAGPLIVGRQPAAFPTIEGFSTSFVRGHDGEQVQDAPSSLSDSIRTVFSAGAGLGPPGSTGQTTVEAFLHDVAQSQPDYYRRFAPSLVDGMPGESAPGAVGAEGAFGASRMAPHLGEGSPEWKLARKEMGRVLVIHLVQSFFASCCAYLPPFYGWDKRRPWILANIDNLDPASRVAVAAFCAMGARASPHSALLGVPLSSSSPIDAFSQASAAGIRREQACRALHTQAIDYLHLLGLTYDPTKENLEALMVMTQMLIFNELVPRRSRSMVHAALGHFKELQESSLPPGTKDDLLRNIGLPLLTCDAIISAYARKKPLITEHDLEVYFPCFVTANFEKDDIQTVLQDCLRRYATSEGLLSHEGIGRAAAVVHTWIAQSQRMFAKAAVPIAGGPPDTLLLQIRKLWKILDDIHQGIRKLQEMLVHLSYIPHGCASDGCADQHLRFVTRLDKDLIDIIFLINTLVSENLGLDSLVGQQGQEALAESDRRVRKALKLVAFYSELYTSSRDPHMCYHVIFSLEVLPTWTTLAVQRHGEPGGPAAPDLEVSETELDWFTKGLIAASFYHPIAISRLQELQQSRRPAYPAYSAGGEPGGSVQADVADPLAPFDGGPHTGHASSSYRAAAHQHQQQNPITTTTTTQEFFSSTAAGETREGEEVNVGARVPAEDPNLTFQGGHTNWMATKEWGRWDDPSPSRS